jgi:hypothetical protein
VLAVVAVLLWNERQGADGDVEDVEDDPVEVIIDD